MSWSVDIKCYWGITTPQKYAMFASRYLRASAKHLNSILTGLVGSHSRRFITNSSRSAAATVGAHAKSQDLPHIEANRRARIELAAAYRGLEKLNLNEGVCNHLTLVAPAANGNGEVMLVIPYGLHWSEVSVSYHLKYVWCFHSFMYIGGSGGGARDVRPHSRSNLFHFHAVFGEKLAE